MSDHLVLGVDRNITPENRQPAQGADVVPSSGDCSSSQPVDKPACSIDIEREGEHDACDENEPLIQTVECRICQEEDSLVNLEVPCACSGSLKYAHRKCVQRWCNEKGDINCEICRKPYQPGYTAPPPPQPDDCAIDMGEGWTINGSPLDLHDPRILAMAAAERHLLDDEYDEYADGSANGAAFCRSAALILMALLLLRHAMSLNNSDSDDDDVSTFFSLFLLRAAGFLLPCYIMAWAISILQRRRQRQQEAEALAASEVAFMIQAGNSRGLHFTVAPGPVVTVQQAAPPQLPV
ncbi:Probable E3 ubiquitin ligase SUD1 [Linum perenne]